jgi:alpha-soluble NSF attachment protein
LSKSTEIFLQSGNHSKAGKLLSDLANEYEKEKLWKEAAEAYGSCADVYDSIDSRITAMSNRIKEVQMRIFVGGEYDQCIYSLETIAETAMNNKLNALSAYRYFFLASLCRLANMKPLEETKDYEASSMEVRTENQRYRDTDVNYLDSKQDKFIEDIILSFEYQDLRTFDDCMKKFLETILLEGYEKELLKVIREKLVEHCEDLQ